MPLEKHELEDLDNLLAVLDNTEPLSPEAQKNCAARLRAWLQRHRGPQTAGGPIPQPPPVNDGGG